MLSALQPWRQELYCLSILPCHVHSTFCVLCGQEYDNTSWSPPRTHFWAHNVKLGIKVAIRCWKTRRGLIYSEPQTCPTSKNPSFWLSVCCVGGRIALGGSWVPDSQKQFLFPIVLRQNWAQWGPWSMLHSPFSILPTVVAAYFSVPKPGGWWEQEAGSSFLAVTFIHFSTR